MENNILPAQKSNYNTVGLNFLEAKKMQEQTQ